MQYWELQEATAALHLPYMDFLSTYRGVRYVQILLQRRLACAENAVQCSHASVNDLRGPGGAWMPGGT